jgi:hypothetical protein
MVSNFTFHNAKWMATIPEDRNMTMQDIGCFTKSIIIEN